MNRRAFWVLFIAFAVAMTGVSLISPIMPHYAESLGASGLWLGLIFAGFPICRAIFMPVAGRLSDRYGRKRFMVAGLVIYGVAALGYIAATTPAQLFVVRLFHGFGSAMIIPVAVACVAEMAPPGEEGKELGTFNIALYLGWGLGPLMGGALADLGAHLDKAGLDGAAAEEASETWLTNGLPFLAMSLMTFVAVGLLLGLFPRGTGRRAPPRADEEDDTPGPAPELPNGAAAPALRRSVFVRILCDPLGQALIIFRFLSAFANGVAFPFLPLIMAESAGITQSRRIGFLMSVQLLGAAMAQRYFGRLADRHDRVMLMGLGSLLSGLLPFGVLFCRDFWSFLVLSLFSIYCSLGVPAGTALTTRLGKRYGMGASMGTFNMAFSLGMIFGPLAGGVIQQYFNLKWAFFAAGELTLLGSIAFILLALRAERAATALAAAGPAALAVPEVAAARVLPAVRAAD